MDNLENQPAPAAPQPNQPSQDELQAQLASVASLVNSVLILIFVLAGAVDYYLWRQAGIARDELVATRNYVASVARNGQAIDEFARKLADYAKTHPDFMPIAAKYGLKATTLTNGGPASTGMAAPATAPKAKK